MALAKAKGDGGIVPELGLHEMEAWLAAGHLHFICFSRRSACGAGHPQYLAPRPISPAISCSSFTPCCEATEADYLAVFSARVAGASPQHAWAPGLYEA